MLPKGLKRTHGGGIDFLKKGPQALTFGSTGLGIDRIVDVDVELSFEELGEARVGEVEHIAAAREMVVFPITETNLPAFLQHRALNLKFSRDRARRTPKTAMACFADRRGRCHRAGNAEPG